MKVIGVGYGRTGTFSLKLALEQLNYTTFHTKEMFNDLTIFNMWYNNIFSRDHASLISPDFDLITSKGFNASTDMPMSLYYNELKTKYPDALFILTKRKTPEKWFQSWEVLIDSVSLLPRFAPWIPTVTMIDRYNRWLLSLIHNNDEYLTMSHPIKQSKELAIKSYLNHNAKVKNSIPRHRLLEYDVATGWIPLCKFLKIPSSSCPSSRGEPFPRSNSGSEVETQLKALVVIANVLLVVVLWVISILIRKMTSSPGLNESSLPNDSIEGSSRHYQSRSLLNTNVTRMSSNSNISDDGMMNGVAFRHVNSISGDGNDTGTRNDMTTTPSSPSIWGSVSLAERTLSLSSENGYVPMPLSMDSPLERSSRSLSASAEDDNNTSPCSEYEEENVELQLQLPSFDQEKSCTDSNSIIYEATSNSEFENKQQERSRK